MIYTLPFDVNLLQEDDIIDMSTSSFKSDHVRSSFIFIRNTDIKSRKIKYDFSKCSYEEKCEFLILFMFGSFDVDIPILTNTWIEILLSKKCDQIVLPCLFDKNEINQFTSDNSEKIFEIYQLIISLPIFALYSYANMTKRKDLYDDLQSYEKTDYNKINLHNFASLTSNPDFTQMIEPTENIKPRYYSEYFMGHHYMNRKIINDNLPYMNILSLVLSSDRQRQSFLKFFENNADNIEKEDIKNE